MDPNKDEQTRQRAYQIWEQEGRPEGRHDEHWERAQREGMMGDGTEEQNLNQRGNPDARIKEDEVQEAFGQQQTGSQRK